MARLAGAQRQAHLTRTLHNYRLTIQTKIKPGLGHLPVTKLDARVLDRFYVVTVMNSASVRPRPSSR